MTRTRSPISNRGVLLGGFWAALSIIVAMSAALALPVTCRCGDALPGSHALVVALERLDQSSVPDVVDPMLLDKATLAIVTDQRNELPQIGSMPTLLEQGLAAMAVVTMIALVITFPRPTAPSFRVRSFVGRSPDPSTPPPRFAVS